MSNNLSGLDPRVRRTRQLLQSALSGLLSERPLDAITVRDITGRAEVNRATFYLHFIDKYDLLWQTIRETLAAFVEESAGWSAAGPTRCSPAAPAPIERLFERLAQQRILLSRLLDRAGNSRMAGQLLDLLEQTLLDTPWATGLGRTVPRRVGARYLAGGLLCLVAWWMENLEAYSAREMAAWYWCLIQNPLSQPPLTPPSLTPPVPST